MHKLLIFLSALAICLTILPISAGAGDRTHRYWQHHQSYYLHQYNRPYFWSFPYHGYIIPTDIETTATEFVPGRSLVLISTNPRTRAFAVYIS